MTTQSNQPNRDDTTQRPALTNDITDERATVRTEKLGLDDVSDEERLAASNSASTEDGGLGFDEVTDPELQLLDETMLADGGLGLDDALLAVEDDEDEYRAA